MLQSSKHLAGIVKQLEGHVTESTNAWWKAPSSILDMLSSIAIDEKYPLQRSEPIDLIASPDGSLCGINASTASLAMLTSPKRVPFPRI